MSGLTIGIDVDDVVAKLIDAWLLEYNRRYDDRITPDDLVHWEISKQVKPECGEKLFELLTPGMYDTVEPYPGTQQAIRSIRSAGHRVAFITSCLSEDLFRRKLEWLHEHGFEWDSEYGISGDIGSQWTRYRSKADVPGIDWLVDDHIGNLKDFKGYPILQTRPHNRLLAWTGKRIKHLNDIVPALVHGNHFMDLQKPAGFVVRESDTVRPDQIHQMVAEISGIKSGWETDLDKGGVKFDGEKLRFDLIPEYPLSLLAETYTVGSFKYDDDNWRKGMSVKRNIAAAKRHLALFNAGEDWDEVPNEETGEIETGQHHLAAVVFNLFTVMETLQTHPEFDDRPSKKGLPVARPITTLRPRIKEYIQKVLAGKGKAKRTEEQPCRKLPVEKWCDFDRSQGIVTQGGFMGHTCK